MAVVRAVFPGTLSATAWFVITAGVLLLIALTGGFTTTSLVLPLAAALSVVAIVAHRPRGHTWWWAAIGSLLWTIEEAYWAAVRVLDVSPAVLLTDSLYTIGVALWLVTLIQLPHKHWPRWTLVGLPPLVVLGILLTRDPGQTLSLSFPITDLILLLVALTALEGTLRGPASDGRLLWTLGFFVRALAAANYSWLATLGQNEVPFHLMWIVAHLLIALGVWLEVHDETGGPWPTAGLLIGIEAVIFVTTALLFARDASPGPELLTVGSLAYVQLLAVLVLVMAERRRRFRAERDLRAWRSMLQRLGESGGGELRIEQPLQELWTEARRLLPGLQGLTTHGRQELTLGEAEGYAFPVVRGGTEVARLHFEQQPESTELLDTLAPLLGHQIRELQDRALWRDHATTDPLTGLRDRRGLELVLPTLLARREGDERSLVVAMLDLDHFKRVNDLHGHPVGDRVLMLLADLLRDHTRENDVVVRWGGEEFLLILDDVDEERARGTLSRLRRGLRDATPAPITHPLTLSAGLSAGPAPHDAEAFYDRITAADHALLRAKREGRDRVEAVRDEGTGSEAKRSATAGSAATPGEWAWSETATDT